MAEYTARCAQDAQASNYGTKRYWDYLEKASIESREYWLRKGDTDRADEMMLRTLSEALRGNDGI